MKHAYESIGHTQFGSHEISIIIILFRVHTDSSVRSRTMRTITALPVRNYFNGARTCLNSTHYVYCISTNLIVHIRYYEFSLTVNLSTHSLNPLFFSVTRQQFRECFMCTRKYDTRTYIGNHQGYIINPYH